MYLIDAQSLKADFDTNDLKEALGWRCVRTKRSGSGLDISHPGAGGRGSGPGLAMRQFWQSPVAESEAPGTPIDPGSVNSHSLTYPY